MKRLSKVSKADEKYMTVDPQPGFDPEHNRRVIEDTIKENDLKRLKAQKEHDEAIKERSSALATYLKSLSQGNATSDMKKYFGRRELARLRGEEILARITDPLIVRNGQGKIIRRAGDAQAKW